MKLPNSGKAWIEEPKLTGYLLDPEHEKGKAGFFQTHGFGRLTLEEALLQHAQSAEVVSHRETTYGLRFVLEGPLEAPDGRRPNVRSVWQVEDGRPRFITAHPH